jgi:hypothetical protein
MHLHGQLLQELLGTFAGDFSGTLSNTSSATSDSAITYSETRISIDSGAGVTLNTSTGAYDYN